jgi:TRAP-type C4-dicarboxylate transport system substrate-binding protein
MKRLPVTIVTLAAVAAVGASCGGGNADKAGGGGENAVVLTLATYSEPDPDELVAAVERLSGGSLRLRVAMHWRGGRSDYEEATIDDVRRGRVALAIVSARAFDLVGSTAFDALLAPFLVDSLELEARVLRGPLVERMLADVERVGVVPLGVLPGPLRRPVGLRRRPGTVADYRGAIVGIRPSRLSERTYRALGARTRPVMFPDDLGRVDATDYTITSLDFSRYDESARTILADVAFAPHVLVVIANRERFAELGRKRQELLRHAVREALEPALARVRANEDAAVAGVCRRGAAKLVSTTAAERAALRAAVQPVYDELARDGRTRDVLAAIRALPRPAADVAACPEETPPSLTGAPSSALDGTWAWTVTQAELLAAGDTPAGAARNAGRWHLDLREFRYEAYNLDSGDVYRGRWRLEGQTLVAVGDETPDSAPPNRYRWSMYRGRLALQPVRGEPFAAIVVVRPLRRLR